MRKFLYSLGGVLFLVVIALLAPSASPVRANWDCYPYNFTGAGPFPVVLDTGWKIESTTPATIYIADIYDYVPFETYDFTGSSLYWRGGLATVLVYSPGTNTDFDVCEPSVVSPPLPDCTEDDLWAGSTLDPWPNGDGVLVEAAGWFIDGAYDGTVWAGGRMGQFLEWLGLGPFYFREDPCVDPLSPTREPSPTPTATATATITPTVTITPTPGGVCGPNDLFCRYGTGASWGLTISGSDSAPGLGAGYHVPVALSPDTALSPINDGAVLSMEPGLWEISLSGSSCTDRGSAKGMQIEFFAEGFSSELVKINADSDGGTVQTQKFIVPVPDLSRQSSGLNINEGRLKFTLGTNYPAGPGMGYSCEVYAQKLDSSSLDWIAQDEIKINLYRGGEVWGKSHIPLPFWFPGGSQVIEKAYLVDPASASLGLYSYTPSFVPARVRSNSDLTLGGFQSGTMDNNWQQHPNYTGAFANSSWTAQGVLELDGSNGNRQDLYIRLYSGIETVTVTPTPTTTATPENTPTVSNTPTSTPLGQLPENCRVLDSVWDGTIGRYRIHWSSYGYVASDGGFRLLLQPGSAYNMALDVPFVAIWTSISTPGTRFSSTIWPSMGYHPVNVDDLWIQSHYDYNQPFSIIFCHTPLDSPTPTATNTATATYTPTITSTPNDTEVAETITAMPTECLPCSVKQTAAAAQPTMVALLETVAAQEFTVIVSGTGELATPTPVPVLVRFDDTSYEVHEADGVVSVLVELSKPASQVVTVDYASAAGSAVEVSDYQETSGALSFLPGEVSKVLQIPIINDLLGEPNEMFGIVLESAVGAALDGFPVSSILIRDDDSMAPTIEPEPLGPGCYQETVYVPWTVITLTDAREITTIGIYGVYLTPAKMTPEMSFWGYGATPFLGTIVPPGKYLAFPADIETTLALLSDRTLVGRLVGLADFHDSVVIQLCPVPEATATAVALTATAATSPTATMQPVVPISGTVAFSNTGIVSACLVAPTMPPDLTGPQPVFDLAMPTLRPLPTVVTSSIVITAGHFHIDAQQTTVALWAEPAETITTWSDSTFGDGYTKGEQDAQVLAQRVAEAFGWLALFTMIGPLAWLLPPIVINLFIQLAKAVLSIMLYIRNWLR